MQTFPLQRFLKHVSPVSRVENEFYMYKVSGYNTNFGEFSRMIYTENISYHKIIKKLNKCHASLSVTIYWFLKVNFSSKCNVRVVSLMVLVSTSQGVELSAYNSLFIVFKSYKTTMF